MAGNHVINMSDQVITVWNYNKSAVIGHIYNKERYVIMEVWVANQMELTNCRIMFRNSSGQFVQGYLFEMVEGKWANSWWDYGFWYVTLNGYQCAALKTDRTAYLYYPSGVSYGIIPANSWVYVYDCTAGQNNPDYMLIKGYNDGNYHEGDLFIDTEIDKNSTNTPVYGNW